MGEMVSLAFTLEKYSDEILCDVVPMEATHVFLGEVSEDQLQMKIKREKKQKEQREKREC
ncbi:hypothetical protein CR513_01652, partial [Mucuna pruriens]